MIISIGIVDDHQIFRSGIAHLLKTEDQYNIIFESDSGNDFLSNAPLDKLDIVLLDISLPGISGISVLKELKNRNFSGKIIMLSMFDEQDYGLQSIQYGAHAYLAKNVAAEELINCLNTISKGRLYISDSLSELLAQSYQNGRYITPHEKLSSREQEVLHLLAEGHTPTDISKLLFISIKTVSTYKARIFSRLDISNQSELIFYCMKYGIIQKPHIISA
ncbi:DNA-binding response regulator [Candidatus Marinamargulisbacteria bacterium SCGC AG-343-D04]|nr:DNA-binding response regulator [Candidatus Marinamargulisbacteria bacterium SCGC AG-343-D04]